MGKAEQDDFLAGIGPEHEAWSTALAEQLGRACAITFAVGSDVVGDNVKQDLEALARRPRGTHMGELELSLLADDLPAQFATRYDYEFVFSLHSAVERLRVRFASGTLLAFTVLEEIALYLIFSQAADYADMSPAVFADQEDDWRDWLGDILQDLDVEHMLFTSELELTPSILYHFDHWRTPQFHGARQTGEEMTAAQLGLLYRDPVAKASEAATDDAGDDHGAGGSEQTPSD